MLATIFTSVIGGLLLAGILAALKTHWLYLIVPKPYLATPLSSGQVISLDITNAGFLTEEAIKIRFNPACRCELVATSRSAVTLSNNTISVPRLARFESATILVLVEGRPFETTDIETVEAESGRGRIVAKKEKAVPLWQYFVVPPLFFAIMGLCFAFGTVLGRDLGYSAFDYLTLRLESFGPSKQLAGFKIEEKQPYSSIAGALSNVIRDGKIGLRIDEIVRRGDNLDIEFTVSNNTSQTLILEASVTSSAADAGPLDFWEKRVKETFIAAGAKKSRHIRAYLPESSVPKMVFLTYRLKLVDDSTTVEQVITF